MLKEWKKNVLLKRTAMHSLLTAQDSAYILPLFWTLSDLTFPRTIVSGQVTNAIIVRTPPAVIDPTLKPTVPLQPFKRHLGMADDDTSVMSLRIVGDGSVKESSLEALNVKQNTEVCVFLDV